jgi:hypothetical protein
MRLEPREPIFPIQASSFFLGSACRRPPAFSAGQAFEAPAPYRRWGGAAGQAPARAAQCRTKQIRQIAKSMKRVIAGRSSRTREAASHLNLKLVPATGFAPRRDGDPCLHADRQYGPRRRSNRTASSWRSSLRSCKWLSLRSVSASAQSWSDDLMSPRLLCATVKEANLPTIVGHFQEYLKRPDVIERMKPWDAVFDGLAEALRFLREEIAAVQRVAEAAPSLGYERMLGVRGVNPILARLMARLLVRRGTRIADESKWFPRVAEAICFLAKPGRRRRAFVRKVQFLLRTWDETSIIETIFAAASLDDFEFVRALQLAADGDEVACRRVTEIAATIAPHVSIRSGPKVSAASAAHHPRSGENGTGSAELLSGYGNAAAPHVLPALNRSRFPAICPPDRHGRVRSGRSLGSSLPPLGLPVTPSFRMSAAVFSSLRRSPLSDALPFRA